MIINPVIAGLTFRQTLSKRRWMIVVLLAAIPVALALFLHSFGEPEGDSPLIKTMGEIYSNLVLKTVVPIIALVLASAGFGAEVEDGTVTYLLTKPLSRTEIVSTKLLVTATIAALMSAAATLLFGVIILGELDPTHLVLGFVASSALASVLYSSIFLALGLIAKRGMLIGLVYLIVWEGVLATLFLGTRQLSVREYALSAAQAITSVDAKVFHADVPIGTAGIMSALLVAGAVLLCVRRLRNFEVGHAG